MIKKILVALDPDTDTPVATRYAIDIARRYDAEVTGLAVVDMGSIEASARGGGIGSTYLMEKVEKNLTEEARAVARKLLTEFEQAMSGSGARFTMNVQEGVPFQRILEEMKFSDLLVVGKEPHFFYSHPDKSTKTLVRIVRDTIAPTLIVPDAYRPVKQALIAFDGSSASARAMRRFVHLKPFGTDLKLEILNIYDKDKQREASELILQMAKSYMDVHGYDAHVTGVQGRHPDKEILDFAAHLEADVLVAGAHSVSKFTKLAFGSTTDALLARCPLPLFLDN